MSNELTIAGQTYISSKRAAELTGYAQDYIGQLARTGKVIGTRVGGLWYILSESILGHKSNADVSALQPSTHPNVRPAAADSSIVSLEGKSYVAAARAAKTTGYHQDYIGQLARGGKIPSKQVGNRWFVDINALIVYKKEKDALLGAVQADAVGLERKNMQIEEKGIIADPLGLHYAYREDVKPLLPPIAEINFLAQVDKVAIAETEKEGAPITIPIRILDDSRARYVRESQISKNLGARISRISMITKTFPPLAVTLLLFVVYNMSMPNLSSSIKTVGGLKSYLYTNVQSLFGQDSISSLRHIITREIRYSRGE